MKNKNLELQKLTQARIHQERAGHSVSTKERLKFQIDHAHAKDAVYANWDVNQLKTKLNDDGFPSVILHTQISTREEFLIKPPLGKFLNDASLLLLKDYIGKYDLVFCVSDGLSAVAIEHHFHYFWKIFYSEIKKKNFKISPLFLIPFARVAVENQIGDILKAKAVVMFIGERPGLSSHDSLGIYLTYEPSINKLNSDSNCISNIRPPHGLSYEQATVFLIYLIEESIKRGYSGVHLNIGDDISLLEK